MGVSAEKRAPGVPLLKLRIAISHEQRTVFTGEFEGPIEMGRQQTSQEKPFTSSKDSGQWRICIAAQKENSISREHCSIERTGENAIQITNLSKTNRVLVNNVPVEPTASTDSTLPASLRIADRLIWLETPAAMSSLQSLAQPTMAPLRAPRGAAAPLFQPGNADSYVEWFRAVLEVLQGAANSDDFFKRAARALVDLMAMDYGRVLLRKGDTWELAATASRSGNVAVKEPSNFILSRACDEKRTFWQEPSISDSTASLAGVESVIAAPILDPSGTVLGLLYGDRAVGPSRRAQTSITELEATLVEVLATGIATGLARLEHERAALAARIQFEQFFSPELARQLTAEPDMLAGKDAEVTLLFCDIRDFSRLSEKLGTARTFDWIGDMLNELSECVTANSGVLVDYIGDELVAMWGAPTPQPDQALQCCQAGLDMIGRLPKLNANWNSILDEPIRVGIGINSGLARVGNTGSSRKFKYGPLGSTVNIASRVQGVTKYLKCEVLATSNTRNQLENAFPARRVATVRLFNIAEPVELYELAANPNSAWLALRQNYEEALAEFQGGNTRKAARILGHVLNDFPNDGPSLILLSRCVHTLVHPEETFDTTWSFAGK